MYLTRITAPARQPVSLDEIKQFCRIEDSSSDQLLYSFILNATESIENETGRKIISQTWRLDLDEFDSEISIPYPNLLSLDSIQYYDNSNTLQTLAASYYAVYGIGGIGKVKEASGYSFPSTYPREKAVQITFTCGYGGITAVPEGIKNAIKTLVYYYYDNRGESVNRELLNLLIAPYCVRGFV